MLQEMVRPLQLIDADGAPPTVTVTLVDGAEAPGPEQFKVYVLVLIKVPVDWDPDVPVQPGVVTVQLVVLAELHEIVAAVLYQILQEELPLHNMEDVGAPPTFTVTVSEAEPPGPEQFKV